jgi:hypothetical protein
MLTKSDILLFNRLLHCEYADNINEIKRKTLEYELSKSHVTIIEQLKEYNQQIITTIEKIEKLL